MFKLSKIYRNEEPSEQQLTNFKNNLKVLDQLIGDNKYVAGNDLTIADFSVLVSTTVLGVNDYKDMNDFPNIKRWFERLTKELPFYEEVNGGVAEAYKERLNQKQ